MLVDAVAAGRPVVSTAFPHAVELLASGAGIVVPQRDPVALGRGDPIGADRSGAGRVDGGRGATARARPVVACGGAPVLRCWPIGSCAASDAAVPRRDVAVVRCHVVSMSDGIGMFEHADHAVPRREHGYCTDDVARLLIVAVREPDREPGGARARARRAFRFLAESQSATGRTRNRREARRAVARPLRRRGLLGSQPLGVRDRGSSSRRRGDACERRCRTSTTASSSGRRIVGRWRSPRSARPRSPTHDRATVAARALLADAVTAIGPVSPTIRLAVARAAVVVRERRVAGGADRRRPASSIAPTSSTTGSRCCVGCSTARRSTVTSRRRRSVAPDPTTLPGRFDQQPIEVAAIADACARAEAVTGDAEWQRGVDLRDRLVRRRATTSARRCGTSTPSGGYDGLDPDRPEPQPGCRVDAGAHHARCSTRRSAVAAGRTRSADRAGQPAEQFVERDRGDARPRRRRSRTAARGARRGSCCRTSTRRWARSRRARRRRG